MGDPNLPTSRSRLIVVPDVPLAVSNSVWYCYLFDAMLVNEDLPQLRFLLWNRASPEVSEEEAFALYEANRQWVDPETMTPKERQFFDLLVSRFGAGLFLG